MSPLASRSSTLVVLNHCLKKVSGQVDQMVRQEILCCFFSTMFQQTNLLEKRKLDVSRFFQHREGLETAWLIFSYVH